LVTLSNSFCLKYNHFIINATHKNSSGRASILAQAEPHILKQIIPSLNTSQCDNIPTKMVRIKHRYLLINILYPGSPSGVVKTAPGSTAPDFIQFHAPTPDTLNASILAKMIREGVGEMFGEWGLGVVAGGLKGILRCPYHSLLPFYPPQYFLFLSE